MGSDELILSHPAEVLEESPLSATVEQHGPEKKPTGKPPLRRKILYLDHTSALGGGEIALLRLVEALDKSRFMPVVLLALEGPLVEKLRSAGIETHVDPLAQDTLKVHRSTLGISSLFRANRVFEIMRYAWRLAGWARRERIALIHTNSLKSDIYGGLAGRLAHIPVLWHIRDTINGSYMPAAAAAIFRGLTKTIPNAVVANSQSTLDSLLFRPSAVITDPAKTAAARSRWAAVVHDGCVTSTVPAGQLSKLSTGKPPVLALIGRIDPWKGQDVFLRAASTVLRRHPDAQFWIVGAALFGEVEYEAKLHSLVDELSLQSNVKFLGFQDDMAKLLNDIDVVVHASTLPEPFGQVIVEAMAAGKPVIASDGGGVREIIVDSKMGLLTPMGDDGKLAEAIELLLSDPKRAADMGRAGRRRVQDHFDISLTAQRFGRVYDLMLRSR